LLTLGGVVANAMIDIANGKDPSPLDQELTWMRGFFRGGGSGIVGDLLSQGMSGQQTTVGPVSGFVTGPTIGTVVDPLFALTFGNLGQAANGKNTHLGSEVVRQVRNMTPGNNLWYTRAAFNRMWADQLQEQIDPNFRQSFRRLERTAAEQGTQYWWAPGDLAPSRTPDMSNVTR